MPYRIRTATVDDAPQVAGVYEPFVRDTVISFETEVPDAEEFARRIADTLARFSFLVAEDTASGTIAGYAYNHEFRSRPAYSWASEISIYLAPEHQGKGLGSALLSALEDLMRLQGIHMSESCITEGNDASVAFHERHGYSLCGRQESCGFKHGRWLSVLWLEKRLLPCTDAPAPRRAPTASETAEVLERANARLAR